MGTYSKSYQTVEAGRVRENESGWEKGNKVATPARVSSIVSMGGQSQPTNKKDFLEHPGIGKPGTVSNNIDAYNSPSNNIG